MTALIHFLIVAAAIYFVVVAPDARDGARRGVASADAAPPAPSDEARLLTEIRDLLARQRGGVD